MNIDFADICLFYQLRRVTPKTVAPIQLMTAATCPALNVDHGKASSTSASNVAEVVDITCDDGYSKVGTNATCSPDGPGKAAWTNPPFCEGLLEDCMDEGTQTYERQISFFQMGIMLVYSESHHKVHIDSLLL